MLGRRGVPNAHVWHGSLATGKHSMFTVFFFHKKIYIAAFFKWTNIKYWFVRWPQPILIHQNLSSYRMVHLFFTFCAKIWLLNGWINILIQFTLICNAVSRHPYVSSFGESVITSEGCVEMCKIHISHLLLVLPWPLTYDLDLLSKRS